MLNNLRPNQAHLKRTLRPRYGWTQATPIDGVLDPAFDRSVDIWPGMAMILNGPNQYTLVGGGAGDATEIPVGLCGVFIGGWDLDEPLDAGVDSIPVWTLGGPDAEFEVHAPAFDAGETWANPANGVNTLIYARYADTTVATTDPYVGRRGQLIPAGSVEAVSTATTAPVARLIEVISDSKIVIGGLPGTV